MKISRTGVHWGHWRSCQGNLRASHQHRKKGDLKERKGILRWEKNYTNPPELTSAFTCRWKEGSSGEWVVWSRRRGQSLPRQDRVSRISARRLLAMAMAATEVKLPALYNMTDMANCKIIWWFKRHVSQYISFFAVLQERHQHQHQVQVNETFKVI